MKLRTTVQHSAVNIVPLAADELNDLRHLFLFFLLFFFFFLIYRSRLTKLERIIAHMDVPLWSHRDALYRIPLISWCTKPSIHAKWDSFPHQICNNAVLDRLLAERSYFFPQLPGAKNGKVVKLFQNKTEQKRKEKKAHRAIVVPPTSSGYNIQPWRSDSVTSGKHGNKSGCEVYPYAMPLYNLRQWLPSFRRAKTSFKLLHLKPGQPESNTCIRHMEMERR